VACHLAEKKTKKNLTEFDNEVSISSYPLYSKQNDGKLLDVAFLLSKFLWDFSAVSIYFRKNFTTYFILVNFSKY
jgi:hypothetical protein